MEQINKRIEEISQARYALCTNLDELYANKELQAQYKAYTQELYDLFAQASDLLCPQ